MDTGQVNKKVVEKNQKLFSKHGYVFSYPRSSEAAWLCDKPVHQVLLFTIALICQGRPGKNYRTWLIKPDCFQGTCLEDRKKRSRMLKDLEAQGYISLHREGRNVRACLLDEAPVSIEQDYEDRGGWIVLERSLEQLAYMWHHTQEFHLLHHLRSFAFQWDGDNTCLTQFGRRTVPGLSEWKARASFDKLVTHKVVKKEGKNLATIIRKKCDNYCDNYTLVRCLTPVVYRDVSRKTSQQTSQWMLKNLPHSKKEDIRKNIRTPPSPPPSDLEEQSYEPTDPQHPVLPGKQDQVVQMPVRVSAGEDRGDGLVNVEELKDRIPAIKSLDPDILEMIQGIYEHQHNAGDYAINWPRQQSMWVQVLGRTPKDRTNNWLRPVVESHIEHSRYSFNFNALLQGSKLDRRLEDIESGLIQLNDEDYESEVMKITEEMEHIAENIAPVSKVLYVNQSN